MSHPATHRAHPKAVSWRHVLMLLGLLVATSAPPAGAAVDPALADAAWRPMTIHGPWPQAAPLSAAVLDSLVILGANYQTLGEEPWTGVMAWSGGRFEDLRFPLGDPRAMTVWREQLYVAGTDSLNAYSILRWDRPGWTEVGRVNGLPFGMGVFRDQLLVHGLFEFMQDSLAVTGVARFDGTTWSRLGPGLPPQTGVTAVIVVADTLCVTAVRFVGAGASVMRFSDSLWTVPGPDILQPVTDLATDGQQLFIAGDFTRIGTLRVPGLARWDGAAWSALPASDGGRGLRSHRLLWHNGELLIRSSSGPDAIQRLAGTSWLPYGDGLGPGVVELLPAGDRILVLQNPALRSGGGPIASIGRFARWERLERPWTAQMTGLNGRTVDARVWNDRLVVSGGFSGAGTGLEMIPVTSEAGWTGTTWQPFPVTTVTAPQHFSEWNGRLLALGAFGSQGALAYADTAWSPVGAGIGPAVSGVAELGGTLFAGGDFTTAIGQIPGLLHGFARFDGTDWTQVDEGVVGRVLAVERLDTSLVVAGTVSHMSAVALSNIGIWNRSGASNMAGGVDQPVNALTTHQGQLIAGGGFTRAGGVPVSGVARWDGSAWHPMGNRAREVYDFAHVGDTLYAVGEFQDANGVQRNNVARWDGNDWQAMGSGALSGSRTLTWAEGYHDELFAGGDGREMFGKTSSFMARLPRANAVGEDVPVPVTPMALAGAPNPSHGATSLRFALPVAGRARLTILDLSGRVVARVLDGHLSAGAHVAIWSGPVRAGLYFARLETAQGSRTVRVARYE